MSLAPRERETLAAIENQLRANAPRLEAMFRVFERDPRGRGRGQLWVSISLCAARRGPGNVIILPATIVILFATCAVAIALLA